MQSKTQEDLLESGIYKGEYKKIPIEKLKLDIENPRFGNLLKKSSTQEEIVVNIAIEFGIDDLLISFSKNGYFDGEPIIVVENKEFYTVVEGNRRISAIKILTEKEKYIGIFNNMGIRFQIPDINPDIRNDLKVIPSIIYKERKDIVIYLGVKHITGVEPWSAYAKAIYISELVQNSNLTLKQISSAIGDKYEKTKNLYLSYKVYEQIKKISSTKNFKEIEDNFSLVTVMINDSNIKKFIGISGKEFNEIKDFDNPISKENESNLMEISGYIFGTGEYTKVIKESRNINKLGQIINNKLSLTVLRNGRSFEEAFEYTNPEALLLDKKFNQFLLVSKQITELLTTIKAKKETNIEDLNNKIEDYIGIINETNLFISEIATKLEKLKN